MKNLVLLVDRSWECERKKICNGKRFHYPKRVKEEEKRWDKKGEDYNTSEGSEMCIKTIFKLSINTINLKNISIHENKILPTHV